MLSILFTLLLTMFVALAASSPREAVRDGVVVPEQTGIARAVPVGLSPLRRIAIQASPRYLFRGRCTFGEQARRGTVPSLV